MSARFVLVVLIVLFASSAPVAADACQTADEQTTCASACEAKHYDACAKLGLAYINSNDGAALPRGVALVEKACNGKSALGCGGLGSLYMGGIGVSRDVTRAVKLFGRACTAGDALSCESLGGWHAQGGGADPEKLDVKAATLRAVPWYERACRLQRPAACAFLGTFILEGIKFPNASPKRVPGLFETACGGGVNVACKFLGDLYAKGDLVRRDIKKANELYAKACKLGYDRGCSAKAE